MDPKLGEHVSQMPLDGPGAEEEPRADLRIRQAIAGKLRDLQFLRGQIVTRLDGSLQISQPPRTVRDVDRGGGPLGCSGLGGRASS
jgi:hypothetical protein